MLLGINGLLIEVRKECVLGNSTSQLARCILAFLCRIFCKQNDTLSVVAIYFALQYAISLPVEDNKVSLSICETLHKCSKLTIQNWHRGNSIWRYVSNLICYITFLLLFHYHDFQ